MNALHCRLKLTTQAISLQYAQDFHNAGNVKFQGFMRAAAFRIYVACACSYEKTIEAILYSHTYWTAEALNCFK